MQALLKALLQARSEFTPITKDKTNPHFKQRYASLDSVLDSVTPALIKNGLVIIQTIDSSTKALITHLYHQSGENINSSYPLPDIQEPQKFGAAITYARRYAICALLSITADEDDDAELAKPNKESRSLPNSKPIVVNFDSSDRALLNAEIESLLKRKNIQIEQAQSALFELFKVRSRQHLSDNQLAQFLDYLKSPEKV